MGTRFVQADEEHRARIMKLHDSGLSFSVIAQRVGWTARTVSRIVKRELEKREKSALTGDNES